MMEDLKNKVTHMSTFNKLIQLLNKLEKHKIYYNIFKIRDGIMISVAVPGERWEIEFMSNGDIETEKFVSNGEIYNESSLDELFQRFSD